MKKYILYFLGLILAAFGLLTLYLSGSIIFDLFDMRTKQGNYVMLIIWMNFIVSFFYIFAAYGFFTHKKYTYKILAIALILLILGAVGFYFHITSGGVYMDKTIKALAFRFGITALFFIASYTLIKHKK